MPFVGYEATRIILDGYSETTGPFAADFDKIAHTSQIVRLGADLSFPARSNVDMWGSLAWAHRFDEALPGISGHVAELASDFSFGDVQTNESWVEVKGGFNAQIRKNLSLHASFSAALDDEDDPHYGGSVGLNWQL